MRAQPRWIFPHTIRPKACNQRLQLTPTRSSPVISRWRRQRNDLYLLHWPNGVTDLSGVVAAFENLRSKMEDRAIALRRRFIRRVQTEGLRTAGSGLRVVTGGFDTP